MTISGADARGGAQLRERVTAAISTAVLDELAEQGYGAFSMSAVAHRAGVGKAALYRRWPSKEPMVVDIVAGLAVTEAQPTDTGNLSDDLMQLLTGMRDVMALPRVAVIATDLFAESLRSPELAAALRSAVTAPRRAAVALMLDRATARGELRADADVDATLDLLAGAHLVRLATAGTSLGDRDLQVLHAMLLRAIAAEPGRA